MVTWLAWSQLLLSEQFELSNIQWSFPSNPRMFGAWQAVSPWLVLLVLGLLVM